MSPEPIAKPHHPIPLFSTVSAVYAPRPSTRVPSRLIPFIGARLSWMAVPPAMDGWQVGESTGGRAFWMIGGDDGASDGGGLLGLPDRMVGDGDVVGVVVTSNGGGELG